MRKVIFSLSLIIGHLGFGQTAELNRNNQAAISFLPGNGNSIFHINHGLNNDLNISQGTNVGAGNIMTIKNFGSVGIGTTSPSQKLHISSGLIRLDDVYAIEWGGTNARIYGSNSGDYLRFRTGNIDRMHIASNGSVGIGTTGPNALLDIYSDKSTDHWISRMNTNGSNWSGFWEASDNVNLILRDGTGNADIYLRPNADSYINSGYFGIGTTNPVERLHVNGTTTITGDIGNVTSPHWQTGAHTLELQNGDGGDVVLSFHRAGHTNAAIKHSALGGLIFSGSGNYDDNHLYLKNNGDFGIGTTDTKGFKLGVNGDIAATEVKVATYANWADFVFKKNYDLPTLKEVEQHIKENGHLKDIPSAEEVKKDGFFLGEMDSKLLQKIEELTLYTIEQEKEIEMLKKENEALKSLSKRLAEIEQLLNSKK
ncbi:hypothetical protein [Flavivirga spongiicola]|uniref:Peptidase S74 domain-containing protein n=1 Tax=Flavivirga spongiicola TaxID=421621 RepID=A0ABU7XVC9_9FLAO|nr:hypothetical protein [Flavivirga sp. MEBiC05379]MDO5979395.1 hypothetical protein [Flavivirga sp. MEBiC05379]